MSEQESLALITQMINRAKDAYHDTGVGAMMWGAVVAVCSLVKFSEIHFGYRLPFDIYYLTLAAVIPQVFISIREKKLRRIKSYDEAFMDYLWLAFGICIFLMIFIINSIFHVFQPMAQQYKTIIGASGFTLNEYIASFFLLLYGLPTFVTGAVFKFKPMLWGGLLCWACCIAALFTRVRIDLLLTALSALAAWFIPGLVMEREYRIHKKEQAA